MRSPFCNTCGGLIHSLDEVAKVVFAVLVLKALEVLGPQTAVQWGRWKDRLRDLSKK